MLSLAAYPRLVNNEACEPVKPYSGEIPGDLLMDFGGDIQGFLEAVSTVSDCFERF